jgi:hypothetical protein
MRNMKKITFLGFLTLILLSLPAYCQNQPGEDIDIEESKKGKNLPDNFEKEFDRLFLSDEAFDLDDSLNLLNSFDPAVLSKEERLLVRDKLINFLNYTEERKLSKKCRITGVASPQAFAYLQAIELLGIVGYAEDIDFIKSIDNKQLRFGKHPAFKEACEEAIDNIKAIKQNEK